MHKSFIYGDVASDITIYEIKTAFRQNYEEKYSVRMLFYL